MGRFSTLITTSTRPFRASTPSAPTTSPSTLSGHHRLVAKKVITTALGTVAIISIFGVVAASQPTASDNSADRSSKKTNSIELNTEPEDTPAAADTGANTPSDGNLSPGVSNTNNSSVSVTVNGQNIPVPENGSTQQTITTPDGGSTNVDISSSSDSQSTSFSSNVSSQNSPNLHSSFSSNVHTEHSSSPP